MELAATLLVGGEGMRSVSGFTDGRIHVTLWEGAFDLAALESADRGIYERLLELCRGEGALEALEALWAGQGAGFALTMRLRRRPCLMALYRDLCRRVVLEAQEFNRLREELAPWRPAQTQALYHEVVGYRAPGEREEQVAAAA
jgi:hypothetical protein